MSETKSPVYLDAELLARVDGLADKAGVDRNEYVEDALRRYVAGRDLVSFQRDVSSRADVPFRGRARTRLRRAGCASGRTGDRRDCASAASVTCAVVDVNVLVSALISPDGIAARLVQHTANGEFELVMSHAPPRAGDGDGASEVPAVLLS